MERHIGISQGTEKNQSAKPARSQERLNTQIYINLEQAIFEVNEDYHVKVAETLDEACKLLEVGFEYVTDIEGKKLFRKRK